MRYRALSDDFDYTFGQGTQNLLVNSPATVGQAIRTRLLLLTGEWYLDTTSGTPYATKILGKNTAATRDLAIKGRILQTQGVKELLGYASRLVDRAFTVQAVVMTIYSSEPEIIEVTFP